MMLILSRTLVPFFLILACLLANRAAEDPVKVPPAPGEEYVPPRGYVCYRTGGPLKIDGNLDKEDWKKVSWTEDFVDIEGSKKPQPRFRTRAKMLWDDTYFYVAAELQEPHVWATLTDHDAVIFQDNDFEVFIDPDGDNHLYAEFEMNALNTGWDLLLVRPYRDGGPPLTSWEIPGLKTAVRVDGTINQPADIDRGWTVEIAFPWKVLGELAGGAAPPRDGDQWRADFSRVEWKHEIVQGKYRRVPNTREDNWVWSPQGTVDMHRPETWGYVQFSAQKAGTVKFNPDRAGPLRHLLHRIYYAEHAFKQKHQQWAKSVEELGIGLAGVSGLVGKPTVETTTSGFEATSELSVSGAPKQRWHIRQDSRIWKD